MNAHDLRSQVESIIREVDTGRRAQLSRELAAELLLSSPPPAVDVDAEVDGLADLHQVARALQGQLIQVEARLPPGESEGMRGAVRTAVEATEAARPRIAKTRAARAELLAQEGQLRALRTEEEELGGRIAHLEELAASVSPERTQALREAAGRLEAEVLPRKAEQRALATRIDALRRFLADHDRDRKEQNRLEGAAVDAVVADVDRLLALLGQGNSRLDAARTRLARENGRLRALLGQLETLATELGRAEEGHKAALALQRAWLDANDTVCGALGRGAPPEWSDRLHALTRRKQAIEEQLRSFDAELAALLRAQEEIQAQLRTFNLTTPAS